VIFLSNPFSKNLKLLPSYPRLNFIARFMRHLSTGDSLYTGWLRDGAGICYPEWYGWHCSRDCLLESSGYEKTFCSGTPQSSCCIQIICRVIVERGFKDLLWAYLEVYKYQWCDRMQPLSMWSAGFQPKYSENTVSG
jgi:hypothetical protein